MIAAATALAIVGALLPDPAALARTQIANVDTLTRPWLPPRTEEVPVRSDPATGTQSPADAGVAAAPSGASDGADPTVGSLDALGARSMLGLRVVPGSAFRLIERPGIGGVRGATGSIAVQIMHERAQRQREREARQREREARQREREARQREREARQRDQERAERARERVERARERAEHARERARAERARQRAERARERAQADRARERAQEQRQGRRRGGGAWRIAPYVTWYGSDFYGQRTACGQTYSANIVGVAHKTLPCGTLVQFSWRGITATAPVIDRGPYGPPGYIFDFSARMACDIFTPGNPEHPCFTRRNVRWRIVGGR